MFYSYITLFLFSVQLLPKFEIGTLLTREFTPYKADESGFYRDMCLRVGKVRSPPPLPLDDASKTWETPCGFYRDIMHCYVI